MSVLLHAGDRDLVAQANNRCRMTELVNSFHVLRGAPGTNPWDQHAFARFFSGGQSHAEKQAAAFVLSVWNGHAPKDGGWWNQRPYRVGRFDAIHAFAVWDQLNKQAFLAWCADPFWP